MWSIISLDLINNLGWSSKQASMPYTMYTISCVIAMSVFGIMQDNRGPKLVITVGIILVGSGFILSGIFLNPIIVTLGVGLIAGAGVGAINAAAVPAALSWYPAEKSGFVSGFVVAGTGASALFYSPFGEFLLNNYSAATTFIVIGVFSLLISLILARNISVPGEIIDLNNNDNFIDTIDYNWKDMFKDKAFYKIWLMYAISSSVGLMITSHASNIALSQINWQGGIFLVIIIAVFNTLGRFIGGVISDNFGRVFFIRTILIIAFINLILFTQYSTKIGLIIGCMLAGFSYGSNFAVFPSIIVNRYGKKNYGFNYGITYTAWGIGGALGPMLAASIFDKTGYYFGAYKMFQVILIIGIIIAFTFKETDKVTG